LLIRTNLSYSLALAICFFANSDSMSAEEPELGPAPRVAADPWEASIREAKSALEPGITEAKVKGDTAWMLISCALVMLMVPGLALFYGGMVRRKNLLATMMQSYAALAVVGLYWIIVGYALAFGPSKLNIAGGGVIGWHADLFFLSGIKKPDALLPGSNIPIYVHVMFQGMFAIVTPALISGALAERIRFWPFCIFMIVWVTFVYCPMAHMVWAMDWFYADPLDVGKGLGGSPIGLLSKMGALDFAGGTVVHIAAGTAGLAAALVLRKRTGYPEHAMHPNSMVLTLVGVGLLWFGWFGFNGGSATASNGLAGSAFAATQAAAAAAGLSWMLVEWLAKGKPTALGLASGIVAGLVAVTPASGFVYMWGGAVIGLLAGVVCYFAVAIKSKLGYDDSLDAFGVHAVGGFLGAVLTGIFCYAAVNSAGADGFFAIHAVQGRPDAIKSELAAIKSEIINVEAATAEKQSAVSNAESALEEANIPKKKQAEDSLASAKTDLKASVDKLDRRKDKRTKLRDELADLIGEDGVKKLVDSTDADRLGIAWTPEELDGDKIKGKDGTIKTLEKNKKTALSQFFIQFKAATIALVFSFVVSMVLAIGVNMMTGGRFTTDVKSETEGLDQTEHGEVGFDFGAAYDAVPTEATAEPKAAKVPPGQKRFDVVVEGVENGSLIKAWSELCMPSAEPIDADFKELYPFVTTVQANRFRLRGGEPIKLSEHIQKLFTKKIGKPIKVRVEE
jgi:ammonium transporter, Amt family